MQVKPHCRPYFLPKSYLKPDSEPQFDHVGLWMGMFDIIRISYINIKITLQLCILSFFPLVYQTITMGGEKAMVINVAAFTAVMDARMASITILS